MAPFAAGRPGELDPVVAGTSNEARKRDVVLDRSGGGRIAVMGIGCYFTFLRPPLLPEEMLPRSDVRCGTTSPLPAMLRRSGGKRGSRQRVRHRYEREP